MTRYLTVVSCALYIDRTVNAVRMMVQRKQIPVSKVHGRLQFDKEKLDRWMARHGRRGKISREDGTNVPSPPAP